VGPIEKLAEAIHRDYVRRCKDRGIKPDDASLAKWEDLPETLRQSNRSQAAGLPRKVATAGYKVIPAPNRDTPKVNFNDQEVELLAELEHERWMSERLAAGWHLSDARDVDARRSPYLVPWAELSEDVRDLDRDTVRRIPIFLAQAGLAIVRRPRSK